MICEEVGCNEMRAQDSEANAHEKRNLSWKTVYVLLRSNTLFMYCDKRAAQTNFKF